MKDATESVVVEVAPDEYLVLAAAAKELGMTVPELMLNGAREYAAERSEDAWTTLLERFNVAVEEVSKSVADLVENSRQSDLRMAEADRESAKHREAIDNWLKTVS